MALLLAALLVGWLASSALAYQGDSPVADSDAGVNGNAQSDPGSGSGEDPGSDSELQLVERESSQRVDAVVIALWSIAAGMTVLLALFIWHTSPRRRLRLARRRSKVLYGYAHESTESEETERTEPSDPAAEAEESAGLGGSEPVVESQRSDPAAGTEAPAGLGSAEQIDGSQRLDSESAAETSGELSDSGGLEEVER